MKPNIGIFSSSRSDTASIIPLIRQNKFFNFKIFICGSHLDKNFGYTDYMFDEFKNLSITKYKTNFEKYNSLGVIKSSSKTIDKLSLFLNKAKLEGLIIIGDRYEALMASYAALIMNIKIFHLGGGELTLGTLDNKFRFAISLFSSLHFVTRPEYKKNLYNYNIQKHNIFFVGDTSQEFLVKEKKFSTKEIEKKFKITLSKKNILVCYHPVTTDPDISLVEFENIIKCLKYLDKDKYNIFITSPNHDQGANLLIKKIKEVEKYKNFFFVANFGKYYYSMLSNCSFIIGNSSSGITDAHLLKVKSINVGNRQNGRISPRSVINVESNMNSIMRGIKKVLRRTNFKFYKPSSLNKNGSKLILRKIKKYLNNEKK